MREGIKNFFILAGAILILVCAIGGLSSFLSWSLEQDTLTSRYKSLKEDITTLEWSWITVDQAKQVSTTIMNMADAGHAEITLTDFSEKVLSLFHKASDTYISSRIFKVNGNHRAFKTREEYVEWFKWYKSVSAKYFEDPDLVLKAKE